MRAKKKSEILQANAKRLRYYATPQERQFQTLWKQGFPEIKIKNQYIIGNYIVDFYVPDYRLVIEIDGGQHCDNKKDRWRDIVLKLRGYRVIRFWNNSVTNNREGVYLKIKEKIK